MVAQQRRSSGLLTHPPNAINVGRRFEDATVEDWISTVSAVAAWIATLEAVRASRLSRRAYALALQQEARLQPSLRLYLVESEVRRLGVGAPRIYIFQIVVSNGSDASNSIREVNLLVEHGRGHGPSSNFIAPHRADLTDRLTGLAVEPLRLPCEIAAHNSLGGLVLFEVPSELLRGSQVEAYTLRIIDTYGHHTSMEILFLQERAQ